MNTSFDHKDTPKNQRHSQHESQSAKTHPSRTIVHAKLEMTDPGDHDEQEADAMADAVVSGGKISRKISSGGGSSGIAVSQQMESQLSQLQGGGRPMPQGLQNMMESGFGQDFGRVRIHTDAEAADMSSSISARAFTLGNDIYFNRGQFSPETTEGQRLVAHELTHVVQGTGKVGRLPEDWDIISSVAEQTKNEVDFEKTLKRGYEELKSHGLIFSINDMVYEIAPELLKAREAYIKKNNLSDDALAWIKKIESFVDKSKLNKISHGFVILNKALTVLNAIELLSKSGHDLSKNASADEKINFAKDSLLLFIGVAGGLPGTIFTIGFDFFFNETTKYIENHPKEINDGVWRFYGVPDPTNILNYFLF